VSAWLARGRPWAGIVAVNAVIMTLFLWHLSAMLVAYLALHPLGFGRETTTSGRWWLERPLWLAASAAVLLPLLWLFSRWERRGTRPAPSPKGRG
jgi:hypothetical protein